MFSFSALPKRSLFTVLFLVLMLGGSVWSAPRRVAPVATPQVISDIQIEGDYYTAKNRIFSTIELKKGDAFDEDAVRQAVSQIGGMGMYSEVAYKTEKTTDGYRVIFTVKERPLISEVHFSGNHALPDQTLYPLLKTKPNQLIEIPHVREDIATINALYTTKGYMDCRVVGVDYPEADGDPLTFRVMERTLNAIRITGNRTTKPYVILREFESKTGEPINNTTLKEDLRRVYGLNYFSKIEPHFEEGASPNSTTLVLDVTERRAGTFTFGGGYGASSGFNLFTNFSWDNFFGMGQSVMLSGNFGLGGSGIGRSNTYEFKYNNPWMWDKRQSFSFQAWSRNGSTGGFNPLSGSSGLTYRDEVSNGLQFGFGFPMSPTTRIQHSFKFEGVRLVSENVKYTVQSYTFQISNDTRDVWFNPTKGGYESLSVERAFQMVNSSLDYTRFDLDLRRFVLMADKQVLAARLAIGYLNSGQIDNANLYAREYYRMGGANSVRGYDELNPFAYGSQQVLASLEYRFLLDDAFQLLFFVDAGYAPTFVDDRDPTLLTKVPMQDISRYRIGKGIGTRITVPVLGSIRLDFGINDHGDSRLHFSIGQSF